MVAIIIIAMLFIILLISLVGNIIVNIICGRYYSSCENSSKSIVQSERGVCTIYTNTDHGQSLVTLKVKLIITYTNDKLHLQYTFQIVLRVVQAQ